MLFITLMWWSFQLEAMWTNETVTCNISYLSNDAIKSNFWYIRQIEKDYSSSFFYMNCRQLEVKSIMQLFTEYIEIFWVNYNGTLNCTTFKPFDAFRPVVLKGIEMRCNNISWMPLHINFCNVKGSYLF